MFRLNSEVLIRGDNAKVFYVDGALYTVAIDYPTEYVDTGPVTRCRVCGAEITKAPSVIVGYCQPCSMRQEVQCGMRVTMKEELREPRTWYILTNVNLILDYGITSRMELTVVFKGDKNNFYVPYVLQNGGGLYHRNIVTIKMSLPVFNHQKFISNIGLNGPIDYQYDLSENGMFIILKTTAPMDCGYTVFDIKNKSLYHRYWRHRINLPSDQLSLKVYLHQNGSTAITTTVNRGSIQTSIEGEEELLDCEEIVPISNGVYILILKGTLYIWDKDGSRAISPLCPESSINGDMKIYPSKDSNSFSIINMFSIVGMRTKGILCHFSKD